MGPEAITLMIHLLIASINVAHGSRTRTSVVRSPEREHELDTILIPPTSRPSLLAVMRRRPAVVTVRPASGVERSAVERSGRQDEQLDPQYQEPEAMPVSPGGGVTSPWKTWLAGLKSMFPQFSGKISDTFTQMFSTFFGGGSGGGAGGSGGAGGGLSRIFEFKRQLISSLIGVTRGGMLRKNSLRAAPSSSSRSVTARKGQRLTSTRPPR